MYAAKSLFLPATTRILGASRRLQIGTIMLRHASKRYKYVLERTRTADHIGDGPNLLRFHRRSTKRRAHARASQADVLRRVASRPIRLRSCCSARSSTRTEEVQEEAASKGDDAKHREGVEIASAAGPAAPAFVPAGARPRVLAAAADASGPVAATGEKRRRRRKRDSLGVAIEISDGDRPRAPEDEKV